ncbi:MAG: hypothetical protein ACWGO1_11785, partial [Anaerolineales bacterium]
MSWLRLTQSPEKRPFGVPVTWLLFVMVASGILLAGCSPLVKSEQPSISAYLPISPDQTAGQTFLARYDGLEGIAVNLSPRQPASGEIRLSLYDSPLGGKQLRTASLPLENVDHDGYYRFNFSALEDSSREDYYFSLDGFGSGGVAAATAPGFSYINGSAYQNQAPADDAQLAFRLIYQPRSVFLGLLREIASWIG